MKTIKIQKKFNYNKSIKKSNKIVNLICPSCGHKWKTKISDFAKGNRCAVCSNKEIVIGVNDLATVYPNLLKDLIKIFCII